MKLFLIHVGFYEEELGIYELHTNRLVVAEDAKAAKMKLFSDEVFRRKKMHIDGIQEIDSVDGYKINVEPVSHGSLEANKSYSYSEAKKIDVDN